MLYMPGMRHVDMTCKVIALACCPVCHADDAVHGGEHRRDPATPGRDPARRQHRVHDGRRGADHVQVRWVFRRCSPPHPPPPLAQKVLMRLLAVYV